MAVKHSPMTSEYSKPHKSKDCPEEHVDCIHFNKEGNPDHRMAVDHITDPDAIEMGRENYRAYQEEKNNSSEKTPSSDDRDSSEPSGNSGK